MNQYYENAKEKGFHDEDTFGPDGTPDANTRIVFAGLILTEWREAKIDARHGCRWCVHSETSPTPGRITGEVSEWADVWIRCADSLGACGEPLVGQEYDVQSEVVQTKAAYVPTAVAIAIENARKGDHASYAATLRATMNFAASQINTLHDCYSNLPGPSEAIYIKYAYSKTRPRKHGKLA